MEEKRGGHMKGALRGFRSTYGPGGRGVGIMGSFADMAAVFGTRKIIKEVWTRVIGKEPPSHPEDPQVRLREALAWAAITGIAVEAARLLAARALAARLHRRAGGGDSA
jgi:Protein of unknown function (DUF4235)